jgi:hypothetical protein
MTTDGAFQFQQGNEEGTPIPVTRLITRVLRHPFTRTTLRQAVISIAKTIGPIALAVTEWWLHAH